MVAASGGEGSVAAKQVLEHCAGLDVTLLVIDLGGHTQVVKLGLHPAWHTRAEK